MIHSPWAGYRPSMKRMPSFVACATVVLTLLTTSPTAAQVVGDTTVAPPPRAVAKIPAGPTQPSRLAPPLSPRRAFIYSALLPGYGQSKLDRGTSGVLFASVEMAAIAMYLRSASDLREAQRYRIDTLPSEFTVNGTALGKSGTFTGLYSRELVNTRRLHLEDWLATIAFNHLFAGADSFVAAQLWDVPVSLSAAPIRNGALVVASLRW